MREEEMLQILSKLGFKYNLEDAEAEAIIKIQDLYNKQKEEIKNLKSENNYWIAKSYLLEKEKEN